MALVQHIRKIMIKSQVLILAVSLASVLADGKNVEYLVHPFFATRVLLQKLNTPISSTTKPPTFRVIAKNRLRTLKTP